MAVEVRLVLPLMIPLNGAGESQIRILDLIMNLAKFGEATANV